MFWKVDFLCPSKIILEKFKKKSKSGLCLPEFHRFKLSLKIISILHQNVTHLFSKKKTL